MFVSNVAWTYIKKLPRVDLKLSVTKHPAFYLVTLFLENLGMSQSYGSGTLTRSSGGLNSGLRSAEKPSKGKGLKAGSRIYQKVENRDLFCPGAPRTGLSPGP